MPHENTPEWEDAHYFPLAFESNDEPDPEPEHNPGRRRFNLRKAGAIGAITIVSAFPAEVSYGIIEAGRALGRSFAQEKYPNQPIQPLTDDLSK